MKRLIIYGVSGLLAMNRILVLLAMLVMVALGRVISKKSNIRYG